MASKSEKPVSLPNGVIVVQGTLIMPNGKTVSTKGMSMPQVASLVQGVSNMSTSELSSVFGSPTKSSKGQRGYATAIDAGIAQAGANAVGIVADQQNMLSNLAKKGLDFERELNKAILPKDIYNKTTKPMLDNLESNITGYQQGINSVMSDAQKSADSLSAQVPEGTSYKLAKLGAQIAPSMMLPASLPEDASSAISGMLGRGASFAGRTAPMGALQSELATSPDQSRGTAGITGAIASPLIGGAITGLANIPALANIGTAQSFAQRLAEKSPATAEQIQSALAASPADDAVVGETLGIPDVQQLEINTIPTMPVLQDKMLDRLRNIAAGVNSQSADVMSALTDPDLTQEEISQGFIDNLTKGQSDARAQSRSLYDAAGQLTQDSGVQFSLDNYMQKASDLQEQYGREKDIFGQTYNQEIDGLTSNILSAQADGAQPALSDLIFHKSSLSSEAQKAKQSGDNKLYSVYNQLSGALAKDIDDGIYGSDSPASVKDAYKAASKHFAENVAPYSQAPYPKILAGKTDPDKIANMFLPKQQKQRVGLLKGFMKNAPSTESADTSKMLLTSYLQGAIDQDKFGDYVLNPAKLNSLLGSLGDQRLSILTGGDEAASDVVSNFKQNYKLNKQTLQLLDNLPTGQRNVANLNKIFGVEYAKDIADDLVAKRPGGAVSKVLSLGPVAMGARHLSNPKLLKMVADIKAKSGDVNKKTLNNLQKAIIKALTSGTSAAGGI